MKLSNIQTIKGRREVVEQKFKTKLSAISKYPPSLEIAQLKNCENMIGATSVPLGIAGPIKINGQYAKNEYYLPLATTEGALVASVNRGCKVINASGGVRTVVENIGISRGSIFTTAGLIESRQLASFLQQNFSLLNEITGRTSAHLQLLKIETKFLGSNVFVRFSFDSQEAMGMNMVTIASEKLAREIEKRTKARLLALAGNFDIDKKPSFMNFLLGRGKSVHAEVIISDETLVENLRVHKTIFQEVAQKKCLLGSILSGSLGYNAHFANILAAIFMATGQDVAHIVEGSLGVTTTELEKDALRVSIYLPDLVIGVIGGGIRLPSQLEALKIIGVANLRKKNNSMALAEIIGGAVLAGEISLLGAIAEGSLASSHQKFTGRKAK